MVLLVTKKRVKEVKQETIWKIRTEAKFKIAFGKLDRIHP